MGSGSFVTRGFAREQPGMDDPVTLQILDQVKRGQSMVISSRCSQPFGSKLS
jgi:hypothetical protein